MTDIPIDAASSSSDLEAVTLVATEYFQSWFAGDAERMRACLHPALAKRTPVEPSTSLSLDEDSAEQLIAHTAGGGGSGHDPWQQVTVLDLYGDIASVAVLSKPFVEYLHLAHFEDRWLIVNALYTRAGAPESAERRG